MHCVGKKFTPCLSFEKCSSLQF
uniref:Uncharacterized protein n=1 Tax=Anguilla anguilla TaxID=7936 RepID=A0A0E9VL44_ANGAN